MIARVVDYVDATRKGLKDVEPPTPLKLAFMCGETKLPRAGGVMEQDATTMIHMRASKLVHGVLTRYRNMKGAEIHDLTNEDRKVLRILKDEGMFTG